MILYTGGEGYGKLTQTAGTRIQLLMGGVGGKFTNLINMSYTAGTTAHTITIMRGQSRTTVNGAVAGGGTSVVVNAALLKGDGITVPAANDSVGIRLSNGTWFLSTISAYNSTTLTYTLNTAIPSGLKVLNGAKFVLFGVAGDSWHASYTFAAAASATTNFPALAGQDMSVCRASYPGEPLMFDSNNATAAGTLNNAEVGYSRT